MSTTLMIPRRFSPYYIALFSPIWLMKQFQTPVATSSSAATGLYSNPVDYRPGLRQWKTRGSRSFILVILALAGIAPYSIWVTEARRRKSVPGLPAYATLGAGSYPWRGGLRQSGKDAYIYSEEKKSTTLCRRPSRTRTSRWEEGG